jgi:hypothetical protein
MLENGQISSPEYDATFNLSFSHTLLSRLCSALLCSLSELLHFISQFQPPSPSKSSPTPLSPAAATAVDSSPHTTPPIQRRNHSLTATNRLALPGMEAKSQQRQEEDPPEEEAEALELSPPQSPRLRYISNSPTASRSPSPAASVSTSASPSDSSESSLIFQNLPYQSPPPPSPPPSEGRHEGITEESEEQIVTPLVIDSPSRSGNGTFDLSVTMIADDDHNLLETRARGGAGRGAGRGEERGEAGGGRRASSPSPPSSPITLHMFREEKPKRKYPQRQELSIKEPSRDNNSHSSSSSSRNSSSHRKLEMQQTQLQMPMLPQKQAQQVQRQHRQMQGNEISLQSSVSIPSQAFKKGTRASAAAAAFEEDYDDLDYERLEALEGSDQLSDSDSELGSQLPVEDRYEEDEDSYYLEEDPVEDEETEQLQEQEQEQQQPEEEEEIYKEIHDHRGRSRGNDNNRGGGGVLRSRDEFNRKPHSQPYGPPSSSHQQKQWDEDTDEQQDEKQRQQEVEEEDEKEEEEEYSAVDREDDSNRSISSRPKPKPKPSSFDPEVLLSHLKSSKREMSPPPQRQRSSSPKTSRAQQTITSVRANSPLNSPKPSPRPEKLSRHSPKGKDNTRGSAKDSGRRSKSRSRSPSPSAGQRAVSLGSSPEIVKELSIRADNVDPLEVAIEVFDSATTLANEGNLEDAIPLYLHVSPPLPSLSLSLLLLRFDIALASLWHRFGCSF